MKSVVIIILVLMCGTNSFCNLEDEVEPGFLGQLRGFVGDLGNVMKDVVHGVKKLGRGIKNIEDFLDATIDEDCYFECPKGEPPKSRMGFVPTSNGCGSYGLEDYLTSDMLPLSNFVHCCNDHDICYETCGLDKDECDLKFKKCLYKKCKANKDTMGKLQYKGCQAGAKILYTGTTALGCKPYINAQRSACVCPRDDDSHDEL
ncbi:unnamed protein product [Allacma fusca]|uniref:Group XIIA secretory phospholipase A2 n=1 Tax=Allacma fusca TaxID=39272 RepID=A0A8J2KL35_9HEXA|nr:unnamed protein product [Allacma fusca]